MTAGVSAANKAPDRDNDVSSKALIVSIGGVILFFRIGGFIFVFILWGRAANTMTGPARAAIRPILIHFFIVLVLRVSSLGPL